MKGVERAQAIALHNNGVLQDSSGCTDYLPPNQCAALLNNALALLASVMEGILNGDHFMQIISS